MSKKRTVQVETIIAAISFVITFYFPFNTAFIDYGRAILEFA